MDGTAIVKTVDDILISNDGSKVTALVLLDLWAAFDTLDHELCLSYLEGDACDKGMALSWFRSYAVVISRFCQLSSCCSCNLSCSTRFDPWTLYSSAFALNLLVLYLSYFVVIS